MDSKTLTILIVLAVIVFILLLFLPLTTGVAYITFWKGRDPPNSGGSSKKSRIKK